MTVQPQVLRDLLGIPFTAEQLAAATAPLEPGVVIAGAGSGKTTVMAARVVWLVVSGQVQPEQVLGLTFTNKASAELSTRIREALSRVGSPLAAPDPRRPVSDEEAVGEPTVSTYHAYAGRLLREHGLWIGVEPSARLLADATRFQVAERVIRRAAGPYNTLDKGVAGLVDDVVALDGELNEHLVEIDTLLAKDAEIGRLAAAAKRVTIETAKVERTAAQRSELASLVRAVRADKERLGVLDFGDQLALAAQLVHDHAAVGATERERYRVVLLDEYQDTSVAQVRLLTDLFGSGHPVTAVGDPFQAIYGWRGASVRGIGDFPTTFRRSDGSPAPLYGLAQNNRSGSRLLDLANALAEPLRERHPEVSALTPRLDAVGEGDTRCALFETNAEEVAWVADGIAAEVAAGRPPRDIAVLVRVRSDFAQYHAALVERGVPVEVVGLGGLLALPEISDLVAMLHVVDDATANPALVRLLAGPRWRIGPRDLELLGRRAAELVRGERSDESGASIEELLDEAVAGTDPTEVVSLSDALERPGHLAYSTEAPERFRRLAAEIRELRRLLGGQLLDLMHRVVSVTGLDVEVGAAPYGPKTRRSDALSTFLDVAASFADLDGDPSVRAFLSYLHAADEFERGLETAAPTASESVKLLTVHKAKGLEWPVVVLPDLTLDVFPTNRGRSLWTRSAATLPFALRGDAADFPDVTEVSNASLAEFAARMRAADRIEELRLAYVAVTRAKSMLIASSHWWGPTQKKPRGPSPYLLTIRDHCAAGHGVVAAWAPEPEVAENPFLGEHDGATWPIPLAPAPLAERRKSAHWVRSAMAGPAPEGARSGSLSAQEEAEVAGWDRDLSALLDEARRAHHKDLDVPLPDSLSASAVVRLAKDPDGLARDLARPMPRPPAPAATRGTRFHAWVESLFGERPLLDRTDLVGAADDDLVPDESLTALQEAFLTGPYAAQAPYRIEAPFQLVLDGRVIRGRIDAVYRTVSDGGFERYDVIDWKTGRQPADPLQLALYRAAWARIAQVPEEQVRGGFYYVATGEIAWQPSLPGAAELAVLLGGGAT